MDFLWFILTGGIAGWLATQFLKIPGTSIVQNIVLGILGAVVGGFLFRLVGFVSIGLLGGLISATVGAVVLILLVQKFVLKK